ncbi:MAG: hypothetical protein K9M45_10405 [Kiritimatiellales bacterium]|nr:hypothetical protein [Kiritimatiellales bacterium]
MKPLYGALLFLLLLLPVARSAGQYRKQNVEGWNITINKLLLDEEKGAEALALLRIKLQDIKRIMPKQRHEFLMGVPIWMEIPALGATTCAVYHPSKEWLSGHGHNPAKARSVELASPKRFVNWSSGQPWMVLHELAHAYHHQCLTHHYAPITEAYANACKTGLYKNVPHINGKTVKAYALENNKEYFAELTEAYFGKNDFFPFNRQELKEYDPVGYAAVEKAWKIRD